MLCRWCWWELMQAEPRVMLFLVVNLVFRHRGLLPPPSDLNLILFYYWGTFAVLMVLIQCWQSKWKFDIAFINHKTPKIPCLMMKSQGWSQEPRRVVAWECLNPVTGFIAKVNDVMLIICLGWSGQVISWWYDGLWQDHTISLQKSTSSCEDCISRLIHWAGSDNQWPRSCWH